MTASEFARFGSPETSAFHGLSAGNTGHPAIEPFGVPPPTGGVGPVGEGPVGEGAVEEGAVEEGGAGVHAATTTRASPASSSGTLLRTLPVSAPGPLNL